MEEAVCTIKNLWGCEVDALDTVNMGMWGSGLNTVRIGVKEYCEGFLRRELTISGGIEKAFKYEIACSKGMCISTYLKRRKNAAGRRYVREEKYIKELIYLIWEKKKGIEALRHRYEWKTY